MQDREFKWGNMVGNVGKGRRSRKDRKVEWVGMEGIGKGRRV